MVHGDAQVLRCFEGAFECPKGHFEGPGGLFEGPTGHAGCPKRRFEGPHSIWLSSIGRGPFQAVPWPPGPGHGTRGRNTADVASSSSMRGHPWEGTACWVSHAGASQLEK